MDSGWGWNQGAEGPYTQPSLRGGTDTPGTNFLQMRPWGGRNCGSQAPSGFSEGRQEFTHGWGERSSQRVSTPRRHFTRVRHLHKAAGEPFWGCRPEQSAEAERYRQMKLRARLDVQAGRPPPGTEPSWGLLPLHVQRALATHSTQVPAESVLNLEGL